MFNNEILVVNMMLIGEQVCEGEGQGPIMQALPQGHTCMIHLIIESLILSNSGCNQ